MSAGSGNNHTPLNLNNLFDRYTKPQFATLGKNKAGQSTSNLPNLLLIVAVLSFSASFAYSINRTQNTTGTRASAPTMTNFAKLSIATAGFNQTHTITTYPTQYKDQTIPATLFTSGEQKYIDIADKNLVKKYLIQQVAKYYIYKDVLQEKAIITPSSETVSLDVIESKVPEYEKLIRENEISTIDFAFIKAWQEYDEHDTKKEIEKKFGNQAKEKALEKITEYKSKLEANEPIDTVLEQANNDKDLQLLNNGEANKKEIGYIRDDNFIENDQRLKVTDNNFHNFLFSQTPQQVSEVYEIGDDTKKIMYMIIYPLKKEEKSFNSINDLILSKLELLK